MRVPWKHFDQLVFVCLNINSIVMMNISCAGSTPASNLKEQWTPKVTNPLIISSHLHPDESRTIKFAVHKRFLEPHSKNIFPKQLTELKELVL